MLLVTYFHLLPKECPHFLFHWKHFPLTTATQQNSHFVKEILLQDLTVINSQNFLKICERWFSIVGIFVRMNESDQNKTVILHFCKSDDLLVCKKYQMKETILQLVVQLLRNIESMISRNFSLELAKSLKIYCHNSIQQNLNAISFIVRFPR